MTAFAQGAFVLAADRDRDVLAAIRRALAREPAGLVEATSGREALELLRGRRASVAIVGVQLSDMSGAGLAELMRAAPEARDVPVLFVGSPDDEAGVMRRVDGTVVDFLAKPLDPIALASRVSLLAHVQARTERLRARVGELESALEASERRHGALFNAMGEGFQLCELVYDGAGRGVDFRFLDVNPAFERHTGLARERVIGRTIREVLPSGDPAWIDFYAEVARTGQPGRRESFAPGVNRHYEVFAFSPSPGRFAALSVDVSERKRTEAALRRAEERLRDLADNMAQLAWVADAKGAVQWYNRRWLEYTGTALGAVQGPEWQALHHPDHVQRVVDKLRHCFETGEPWEDTFPLRGADGGYRWFLSRAVPIRDATGEVVRWLGTNTDVTEAREVEQALRRSEEQRRLAVDAARLGTWDYNLVTGEIYWDQRFMEIYGVEAARMRYRELIDKLVHPGDRERVDALVARTLDPAQGSDGAIAVEYRVCRPDGSVRWVEVKGRAVYEAAGPRRRAVRFLGTVADVTAAKSAEVALRESEARARDRYAELDQIYRYAPVGLFTFDREYRFQRINERMAEINGFTPEEHIGRPMDEIVPDLADFLREVYRPVLERGEPVLGVEVHGATPKAPGIPRDWICSYFPLKSGSGEIVGLIGAVLEVTERKDAERALQAANEQLRLADRRKNEFLAMLSHELRNPLAPIRNSVYILERAPAGGEQAQRAREVIDRQAQHLTRLIEDLLDVTRISRGKIILQRRSVELNELVRGTVEDHRDLFANRGVTLTICEAGAPMHVTGDPTRLAQAIGNLLVNAAKFTPSGGHTAVSVGAAGSERALIRVRDSGAGIEPGTIAQLFEPFVQADVTLDRSRGGLGLGLALVKGLIEMHGGTVRAASEGPGKGAEFAIELPLRLAPERSDAAAPEAERQARVRRVLVIEDNPDAAETLSDVLQFSGHQVEIAMSGPEGVASARRFRPDVVLCDIGLPGMDGYEVARVLRADPSLRATYLVALSGYATHEDVEKALASGFDRHLAKPPRLDALDALLAQQRS